MDTVRKIIVLLTLLLDIAVVCTTITRLIKSDSAKEREYAFTFTLFMLSNVVIVFCFGRLIFGGII